MLDNSRILVTGGTGSFGHKFIEMTLEKYSPERIMVYSRDEMKQWEMKQKFHDDKRLRFFQGDVRDLRRLRRACDGVDVLVHAAALKIVPAAEYNPFETIKTNIHGAMNVIDCAIDEGIKRVVALSTDKACNPINLYGATKLCSDKLFVAGNAYVGTKDTRFAVVRYGNVMGSRGSVIPFFYKLRHQNEIPITDERMTRFMITLDQGVELVWDAIDDMTGGEIYVRKIPSMKVVDIAKAVAPNAKIKIIGIRPGEKIHEQMISVEDAVSTFEYKRFYKIFPQLDLSSHFDVRIDERDGVLEQGRPCSEGFLYSSDTNTEWMSPACLRKWIDREYGLKDAVTVTQSGDLQPSASHPE